MSIIQIETVLESVAARARNEVRVSMPGVILDYDTSTQTATVQPVVREGFIDEDDAVRWALVPPVPQVPVCHWRTADFAIHAPLKPGDFVTLVVSDRSIDEFMASGNQDNIPNDTRRFDWTDAIVLPLPPAPTPISGLSEDDMFVGSEGANLVLTPTGKMAINAGGEELIDLVEQLVDLCISAVTGMGVPAMSNHISSGDLVALKAKLAGMKP